MSLYYSKALSSVVHTFEQLYLQEQLANFSQILSVKHLWVGGKAALDFGADRIKTVVTMATESSHGHIMGKTVSQCFLSHLYSDLCQTCRYEFEFGPSRSFHYRVIHP